MQISKKAFAYRAMQVNSVKMRAVCANVIS